MQIFYIVLVLCIGCVIGQDHNFADQKSVHDQAHIKQHLDSKIDIDEVKLDPEKERFHYFSMHDLNQDNLIDGIEIAKAITHSHDEDSNTPTADDIKIEQIVDSVLKNLDANNDGFIDYIEYVRNQEGDKS
uniref:Multiple coagulation factor deficiency protein 2 n=1 Tax=Acrobeloides nanus TaxID=290746 RepID=A0A914CK07_9BILA